MPDAHKNLAVSAVATAPTPAASGTTLVVTAGHGTRFPAVPFNATVWATGFMPDPTNAEIVRVTNITGDTLTITRAQEGTSARAIVVGDQIAATITAKTLTDAEAPDGIAAVVASNTTYTSGTVSLTGVGGGVTVSSNTGQRIDISVAAPVAQSVQPETQTFIGGVSASDTLYTSGSVRLTGVGGGITVGSNTGQRIDLSVAAPVAQTVQTQNVVDLTLSGNTAGALALVSSGTLTLAGGNNITVSQAGNAVTISGANAGGAQTGISGVANSQTTYTSGTVSLSEQGAITIRSTTGNQFQFSVDPQSVQPETQTFLSGIRASDTTYTSGNVTITGVGGGITVSSNTGQRIDLSVAAQSVQPETQTFIGGVSASDTLYTSGSVRFTGSQAVTVRSGTGQLVVIDVPAQSVQAETQTFVGGISASDTVYTSGTVKITGVGGGVTVSSNTGQRVDISVAAQSVQPETQTFVGGISASDTVYTSGTVKFSGVGGGITVSSNTGQRVDLSVAAQTNQAGSVYASSNTFGTSSGTYDARSISIAGRGAVSVAASNSGWIISAPVQTTQVETQTFVGGIANSQTTYTSGTVSLSELGAITIRSTTGNQYQLSVNAQSVQPETQTFVAGIANSQTTYTSGTVSLSELGAITVRSTTGNQYQLSVNAQTNQAGSVYASSNTFGTSSGTYDARSISIAGRGAVSVAASNSGWIISAPAQSVQAETQTFVGGIANSQTTYTSGTVSLSELGAVTIRSTTGNQYQISVNAQSVQAETQTFVGGIANSQTTYTSGTVSLSELGAITVRSTTGNQYQLSVNSQTVQTQGIIAAGLSTGGNTSGDTGVASGTRLVFVGSNNVTLSEGTAANATTITISGPTTAAQTVQTQGILNVALSNIGNTSGDTGIGSGTRYVLAGGNGITLSGSSAANATTVTISGVTQSVQTQGGFASLGVSTGGNTAGNTQVSTGSRFVLVGSNLVSLSQGTAAGASTVTIDASNQNLSVGASTGGNTSGNTTVNSGSRLVFVGSNNITVSQGTAAGATTLTISGPATSAQQTGISGIANSQTTYTSGTVSISELGAVTFRSTTGNQYQISVNSQTVQTQNFVALSATNTLYTSGTVLLTGSNMITVKSSGAGQTVILDATQSVQTQGILNVALSNVGNTSGDTGLNSGTRMVLAGGNNITLSASTAANATTITISAPNLGAGAMSAGVSTGGNTAGSTGITGTQMVLVGTNMISLSQSTGANGGTVSINATQSVQTQGVPLMGVSTGGATSGDTTVNSGTRFVLAGTNLTMSQSTAANATTVTVSAPATSSLSATGRLSISTNGSTISIGVPDVDLSYRWIESPLLMGATQGIATSGATNTTLSAWVMPMTLPQDLNFNNLYLAASNSFTSATTSISSINHSFSQGASIGFYTLTGSTMSLVTSFSNSLGYSNATAVAVGNMSITARVGFGGSSTTKSTQGGANNSNILQSISGQRKLPFVWTTKSESLSRGQYFAVAAFSALTGGNNQAALQSVGFVSGFSAWGSAMNPPDMMANTASVTSPYPFLGMATLVASTNSLMPVSFDVSKITTATATANSTAFQSIWMNIYSSHLT